MLTDKRKMIEKVSIEICTLDADERRLPRIFNIKELIESLSAYIGENLRVLIQGGMAERFKAAVLKTAFPPGNGGSNPSPSANSPSDTVQRSTKTRLNSGFFIAYCFIASVKIH